jgi:hypothetical protein
MHYLDKKVQLVSAQTMFQHVHVDIYKVMNLNGCAGKKQSLAMYEQSLLDNGFCTSHFTQKSINWIRFSTLMEYYSQHIRVWNLRLVDSTPRSIPIGCLAHRPLLALMLLGWVWGFFTFYSREDGTREDATYLSGHSSLQTTIKKLRRHNS